MLKAKKTLISSKMTHEQKARDARKATAELASKHKSAADLKAEQDGATNPLAVLENGAAQRVLRLQQTALSLKMPDTTPIVNDIMSVTDTAVQEATEALNDENSNGTAFDAVSADSNSTAGKSTAGASSNDANVAIATARKAVNDANIEADTVMKKAEMFAQKVKLVAAKAAKATIAVAKKEKVAADADLAKAAAKESEAMNMEEATAAAKSKAVKLAKQLEEKATAENELDHQKAKELQAHVESNTALKDELRKHGDLLRKYEAVVEMQRSAVNGEKLTEEDKAKLRSFVASLVSADKSAIKVKKEALKAEEEEVESMPPGPDKEERERADEEKEAAIKKAEEEGSEATSKDFDIPPEAKPPSKEPDSETDPSKEPDSETEVDKEKQTETETEMKTELNDKDAEIKVLKAELKGAENKEFNKDVDKLSHEPGGEDAKVKDLTKEPGTVVPKKTMEEISKMSPADQQAHADKLEMQNREHAALLKQYEESKAKASVEEEGQKVENNEEAAESEGKSVEDRIAMVKQMSTEDRKTHIQKLSHTNSKHEALIKEYKDTEAKKKALSSPPGRR